MKVDYKGSPIYTLGDISCGDCFRWAGSSYIKTDQAGEDGFMLCASIESGVALWLDSKKTVKTLKIKMVEDI